MVYGSLKLLSLSLKKSFDPIKEKLHIVISWIRLSRLPLKMWNDRVLRHILTPAAKPIKIDHKSKELSKGC